MAVARCLQVLNGVVKNVIMADPDVDTTTDGSTLVASATGNIDDSYSNGVLTPQTPPPGLGS